METLISMQVLCLSLLMVLSVECEVMSSAENPMEVDFIDMAEYLIKSEIQYDPVKNGKFFNSKIFIYSKLFIYWVLFSRLTLYVH